VPTKIFGFKNIPVLFIANFFGNPSIRFFGFCQLFCKSEKGTLVMTPRTTTAMVGKRY